MATKKASKKVETLNPNTGRKMNIDSDRYHIISNAIKKVLKGKTLTFTEIVDGVVAEIKKN